MRPMTRFGASVLALTLLAGTAHAQRLASSAKRAFTDGSGTYLRPVFVPGNRPEPTGFPDSILWTSLEPISIPASCGLSQSSGHAWVGEQLNTERLQLFAINGSGTPLIEFPGDHNPTNPAAAACAMNGDLAVFLNQVATNGPFVVRAYRSNSTQPIWTYNVAESYIVSGTHNIKVSRDGTTVVLAVSDGTTANAPAVITLNASDGSFRSAWTGTSGGCYGVEITDDGSRAIICEGSPPAGIGRLIDTTTGTQITTFSGNGAGGWYNISGNGNVIVIGGFDFRVFVWNGTSYQPRINFSAPGSWFSWGSAVSRDGSTVAALSHIYTANYLNTDVRIWDVATAQLLGTASTVGSGQYQDSAVGGVLSDDGSRFVVASWGVQIEGHPEVRVFDRTVTQIAAIDTPGSPFGLDMSGSGRYVIAGSKSVHANVFGNGGQVDMLEIPLASCYANCDGSTAPPILNINDFVCFQSHFAAGDSYANCDQSTSPPVLNINDFICFQSQFAAGCQ